MSLQERFYRTDYWIQTVVGFATLLLGVSFVGLFFALIGLFGLGCWQLLSALLRLVIWRDTTERWKFYLIVAVFYLILGYLLTQLDVSGVALFVIYMLGALVIGFWHYTMVRSSYHFEPIVAEESASDILDDQIF